MAFGALFDAQANDAEFVQMNYFADGFDSMLQETLGDFLCGALDVFHSRHA